MSFQIIHLVGKQTEEVASLQELLEEDYILSCRHFESLAALQDTVSQTLPDLIVLFADTLEAEGEDLSAFCQELRETSRAYRPILVVVTATDEEETRIRYLLHGADDILQESLSLEELRIRLLVHLRRNLEVLSNPLTRLPGLELSTKMLQRRMNLQQPWALLVIEIDHFDVYSEVYGHIPGDQVLRTFAALLGSLVLPPDFIGQTEDNRFWVLTQPEKAEKIAALLCRQFETVAPNFYSEKDKKRGYIVSVIDEKVSRRVALLSLSIGIVTSQTQAYETYQAAYTTVSDMVMLAQRSPGNSWVSDRLRLTGTQSLQPQECPKILVVESDAALAFLLKTTLELQHYEVETVSHIPEVWERLAQRSFQLVLLDSLIHGDPAGWALCEEIKVRYPQMRVIFISTLHDRDQALRAGADLYLPKPFELVPLFTWIERLLREG